VGGRGDGGIEFRLYISESESNPGYAIEIKYRRTRGTKKG